MKQIIISSGRLHISDQADLLARDHRLQDGADARRNSQVQGHRGVCGSGEGHKNTSYLNEHSPRVGAQLC